jgi:hypothetical protein
MDDLRCNLCGTTNLPNRLPMVELIETYRGQETLCASCGNAAPYVPPVYGRRGSASTAPMISRSAVPRVEPV